MNLMIESEMVSKNREYHVTAGPSWFPFRPPVPAPVREKVEPSPTYSVPKNSRRSKMPPVAEGKGQTSKTLAISRSKSDRKSAKRLEAKLPLAKSSETKKTVSKGLSTREKSHKHSENRQSRRIEANIEESENEDLEAKGLEIVVFEPNDPEGGESDLEDSEEWSEWYIGDDRQHLWRARQLPDQTWEYQYRPLEGQSGQSRSNSQGTSATTRTYSTLSSQGPPISRGLLQPPASTIGGRHRSSPKSSYPTIITTSTGQPTEKYPTSSPRLSAPFLINNKRDHVDEHLPTITITAEKPSSSSNPTSATTTAAAATIPQLIIAPKSTIPKRPMGPVMWLLQEGSRSRKSQKSVNTAPPTTPTYTTPIPPYHPTATTPQHQAAGAGAGAGGAAAATAAAQSPQTVAQITKSRTAYYKKFDKKIRSEKPVRMDPRKKIKAWLKKVEVDHTLPIPLDELGFPVYR